MNFSFNISSFDLIFGALVAALLLFVLLRIAFRIRRAKKLPILPLDDFKVLFESLDEISLSPPEFIKTKKSSRFKSVGYVIENYFESLEKISTIKGLKLRCYPIFSQDFQYVWENVRMGDNDDIIVSSTNYEGSKDGQFHYFLTYIKIVLTPEHRRTLVFEGEYYHEALVEFINSIDWDNLRVQILDSIWDRIWQQFYAHMEVSSRLAKT